MEEDKRNDTYKIKKRTKRTPKRIPKDSESEMEKTKKYKIKKKKHPKLKKAIIISILVILLLIIIVAGIFVGKIYGVMKAARLDVKDVVIKYENSVVKDINGNTIAVLSGDENRDNISISEMSKYIPKAFVAIEDERFYEHNGVDVKRTGAATIKYIFNGGKSSFGGSTITQQLVKNITEEKDRTWERKVKEISRAYYLEQDLSKSQILELYLNLIFLGDQAYGVEVASNYYFSKKASELTLAESAFLAGINRGPNFYEPFSTEQEDIDKIKNVTRVVIEKMYELGKEDPKHKAGITEEEYKAGIAELENGLVFKKGVIAENVYSYHTDAAINQVKSDLKKQHSDWTDVYIDSYVKSGGLTIYTTQNTDMQNIMEEEVKKDKYLTYSKSQRDENGNAVSAQTAMVLMDHKTGYVLATVGAIGEKTTAFGLNRATQSKRQPGSSMKPLAVLCPGIDKGIITAGSVYDDIPYTTGKYANFKNYASSYQGLTTVRYNIAQSKNIPMLKAINDIGVSKSVEFLKTVGINVSESQHDMTIALGSAVASPLQMAAAYAAIANDGVYIEPTFYTKVVDSDENEILKAKQEQRTVMSTGTAYVIKEILTEVVRSGAGSYAGISGMSVGVKTGTSNEDIDRWFCGFTPYYTAAAWYGFDKGETVVYPGNQNPAGRIWDGVMEPIHKDLEKIKFSSTRPSNVTTATICKSSGLLATEDCKNDPRGNQVYTEYFIKGTQPKETCKCHVAVDICKDTGLLANEYCTNKETKVYITRPETETGNWERASDAKYMLIKETCTTHTAPAVPENPEPENPNTPTTPENPEPENPNTPTTPENPEPENPNTPTTPENPEPENPNTPTTPENPEPENPNTPTTPETPKPENPTTPETPEPENPITPTPEQQPT